MRGRLCVFQMPDISRQVEGREFGGWMQAACIYGFECCVEDVQFHTG